MRHNYKSSFNDTHCNTLSFVFKAEKCHWNSRNILTLPFKRKGILTTMCIIIQHDNIANILLSVYFRRTIDNEASTGGCQWVDPITGISYWRQINAVRGTTLGTTQTKIYICSRNSTFQKHRRIMCPGFQRCLNP